MGLKVFDDRARFKTMSLVEWGNGIRPQLSTVATETMAVRLLMTSRLMTKGIDEFQVATEKTRHQKKCCGLAGCRVHVVP